ASSVSTASSPPPSFGLGARKGRVLRSTPYPTRLHTALQQSAQKSAQNATASSQKTSPLTQVQPSQTSQPQTQQPQGKAVGRRRGQRKPAPSPVLSQDTPTPTAPTDAVVSRCVAVTAEPLPRVIGNDYKEFLNCCRFVKFLSSASQKRGLFDLWKDFMASDSYLATKKAPLVVKPKAVEKPKDESVIESNESSLIDENENEKENEKENTNKEAPITESKKKDNKPITPVPINPSIFITSHPTEEPSDPMQATVVGSMCGCIRTEMDFLSLSRYTSLNHPVSTSWIPAMFAPGTLAQPFLASHNHHFLNWTMTRLHLSLDSSTVIALLNTVSDIIAGKEKKRRGRPLKTPAQQPVFSSEETRVNKNREAMAVVAVLAFVADRLQTAKPTLLLSVEMETAIKECVQSVWRKDTLLSRTPSMWKLTRYEMVKVLEGMGRQFQESVAFRHFLKCVSANETEDMVLDCLLLSTDIEFKTGILDKMKTSVKKQKEVLVIATEYDFACKLEKKASNTLLTRLMEKTRKLQYP
ncbi:hypothetical protein WA556_002313, partial [Blastocystis sp. ATCC 50177/Nand II]